MELPPELVCMCYSHAQSQLKKELLAELCHRVAFTDPAYAVFNRIGKNRHNPCYWERKAENLYAAPEDYNVDWGKAVPQYQHYVAFPMVVVEEQGFMKNIAYGFHFHRYPVNWGFSEPLRDLWYSTYGVDVIRDMWDRPLPLLITF